MMKNEPEQLRKHNLYLGVQGKYRNRMVLRPMTEDDWDILLKWNQDPEVLYYSEGNSVESYSLEDIHGIYRSTSRTAYCFIIELASKPIGECWIQKMNLAHVLRKYPDCDCRRIDLVIGEKQYWNKGIGTEVIRTLVKFGFEVNGAERIFGIVDSHNERSRKAFEKSGFSETDRYAKKAGGKAKYEYELCIARNQYYNGSGRRNEP